MGVPQNGRFIKENPTKMDDVGVPLFQETSIYTIKLEGTLLKKPRYSHPVWPPRTWDVRTLDRHFWVATSTDMIPDPVDSPLYYCYYCSSSYIYIIIYTHGHLPRTYMCTYIYILYTYIYIYIYTHAHTHTYHRSQLIRFAGRPGMIQLPVLDENGPTTSLQLWRDGGFSALESNELRGPPGCVVGPLGLSAIGKSGRKDDRYG